MDEEMISEVVPEVPEEITIVEELPMPDTSEPDAESSADASTSIPGIGYIYTDEEEAVSSVDASSFDDVLEGDSSAPPAEEITEEELTGDVSTLEELPEASIIEESRPFLTTPFIDYTVSEGLLLLLFLSVFLLACWQVVRGVFRG